jgi:hypothetical protein
MLYSKSSGTNGPWLDKDQVRNGQRFAILTEAKPIEEVYKGQQNIRNTVKVKVEGMQEPQNYDLNKPTVNGLIDAFGEDSRLWIGKVLTAYTENVRVAGRAGVMLILIPEGYKVMNDEGGYAVVVPMDTPEPKKFAAPAAPVAPVRGGDFDFAAPPVPESVEIRPEDIPF